MDDQTAMVLVAAIVAVPLVLAVVIQGRNASLERERITKVVEKTAEVTLDTHAQVVTLNGMTMGGLADADESRRVAAILPKDRTAADVEHLLVVPVDLKPDGSPQEP